MSLARTVFDIAPATRTERTGHSLGSAVGNPSGSAGLTGLPTQTARWLRGRPPVADTRTATVRQSAVIERTDTRQAAPQEGARTESVAPEPVVSVVVPTFKRPELLERCLLALVGQTGVDGPIEIIVVDDARSPRQEAALLGYMRGARTVAVRYLHPVGSANGPAAARNTGWRAAHGGIVAFIDDDSIPDRHWLREGLRAMQPGIDAAWGPLLPATSWRDAQRTVPASDNDGFRTANCFIRREALERIGGFDERFTSARHADPDLFFSLVSAECLLNPATTACVRTPAVATTPSTSLRRQRDLMLDALLYRKHNRQESAARPPWRYYAIVLAALVAVGSLAAGQAAPAVGAIVVWLALTLPLVAQDLRGGTAKAGKQPTALSAALHAAFVPLVAVFWRLAGAVRYRVPFV